MKMRYAALSACFVLLLLFAAPLPGWAWGQEGHRVIAEITYQHLSPVARCRVNKVLGKHGLVYWANWPDEIKSDTIYPYSHDWHYQDLDGGMSDSAVVATLTDYPKEGGNLWRATDSLKQVLRLDRSNYDALRFLIHLEGDRFCPMHTAHMDDKGGNAVKLKWFGENHNLHWVWDTGLIDARGYTYSEYAECLENQHRAERRTIEKMSDEEILLHNYHLCEAIYAYQTTWNGNAYNYVYRFKDELEWNLYAAGIRLAQILNAIY